MSPRRVLPLDAGRREAPLPGLRRRLRETVGGDHHEPGVQMAGIGVRRRPDGRRHRPHRPPREARPFPWGVLTRASRPHAGGAGAQKGRARPARALLKSRCPFCSNPLDATRQIPASATRIPGQTNGGTRSALRI